MKNTKLFALALVALLPLALTACLKPVSLDAYGYVAAIAVDEGEDGGYYFTLALQRELAEQNTELEGGAILLADSGANIFEALSKMEGSVPYSINFSRANFIVMPSALAERGALHELAFMDHDRLRMRTSAAVVVTECRAYEFLGAMYSNNDANINKLQSALTLDSKRTGMARVMSLSRLIEAELTGESDFVTILASRDENIITDMEQKKAESEGKDPLEDVKPGERVGGLKAYMTGTALFSGCRMTGRLTRDETLIFNLLMGELEQGTLSAQTGEGRMTVALMNASSSSRASVSGGRLEIALEVRVFAEELMRSPALSEQTSEEFIENGLPAMLEERIISVLQKLSAASCDPLRAKRRAKGASRLTREQMEEAYMNAVFSVRVRVTPAARSDKRG